MRCMKNQLRLEVGKKIRALRTERKLTQDGLAEKAGIDYKYIQKIEGKKPPAIRIDTIGKIAKALKVSPSELLQVS